MIETIDLTSYISGYDDYLNENHEQIENDKFQEYQDEILEREFLKMDRKIIDLEKVNLTFEKINDLENYVLKGTKLIPQEMIYGE